MSAIYYTKISGQYIAIKRRLRTNLGQSTHIKISVEYTDIKRCLNDLEQ